MNLADETHDPRPQTDLQSEASTTDSPESVSTGVRPRRSALTAVLTVVVLVLIAAVGVAGYYTYQAVVVSQQPQTLADVQVQQAQQALAAHPGDLSKSFQLAAAYYQAKDYDNVVKVLQGIESKGATGTPLAECTYGIAKVAEVRGDVATAIAGYQRSISIADNADARYALGMIYMQRKQYSEAIPQFKAYLAINTMDSTVFASLGSAYENTGDKVQALAAYKNADIYVPNDPTVVAAIKRLGGSSK